MSRELSLFLAGVFLTVGLGWSAIFVAWLPRNVWFVEKRTRMLRKSGALAIIAYLASLGMFLT